MDEVLPDLSHLAALLGEPARLSILSSLLNGETRPASELARIAGLSPQAASAHLTKLVQGNLLAVDPAGRNRFFRLANDDVAYALEAINALASRPVSPRTWSDPRSFALRNARTCYDHLAGRVAVEITDAFVEGGLLEPDGRLFVLTAAGAQWLDHRGVDVASLRAGGRTLARRCKDLTERRPHIGGALGVALYRWLVDRRWIRRGRGSRAVFLTPEGDRGLRALLRQLATRAPAVRAAIAPCQPHNYP
jgi:DNA-binding transcriptional ArsR family regulator